MSSSHNKMQIRRFLSGSVLTKRRITFPLQIHWQIEWRYTDIVDSPIPPLLKAESNDWQSSRERFRHQTEDDQAVSAVDPVFQLKWGLELVCTHAPVKHYPLKTTKFSPDASADKKMIDDYKFSSRVCVGCVWLWERRFRGQVARHCCLFDFSLSFVVIAGGASGHKLRQNGIQILAGEEKREVL